MLNNLLVIGYIWPEPSSSAAGKRMMQLLDIFKTAGYELNFASPAINSPFMPDLGQMAIKTIQIKLNNSDFDAFVQRLQPEIVVFDRFMMEEQFGWRVSKACPNALKILDTEDLHFLRNAREEVFKKGGNEDDFLFTSDLAKREIASIYRCDLSLIISETEVAILQEKFCVDPKLLFYLPLLYPQISAADIKALPEFGDRKHFISIGTFRHQPNWNALLYLKEEIWPLIREKLPEAQLQVYGSYPSQKVYNLNHPSTGFLIKGRAESAGKVMQSARMCLAPIRFGAGLKGKLLEAMQYGTPSITTTVGAEGISGKLHWNGHVENKPTDFAEAAIALYSDSTRWKIAQENGFQILKERFFAPDFEPAFLAKLPELLNGLTEHRKRNFIGRMLQHHQHKSTYFMSKYIEEKNKK